MHSRKDDRPPPPAGILPEELTPKQRQVLKLIADGFDQEDIEHRLAIHGRMVRHHLTAIYRKAGVSSLQGLQAKVGVLRTLRLRDGRLTFGPVRRKA